MGVPGVSPPGVLESGVRVLGFPGRTGDWEVSGTGSPLEG